MPSTAAKPSTAGKNGSAKKPLPAKTSPAAKPKPTAKPAPAAKPKPSATPPAANDADTEGSAEAFAELLPEAQKIPAASVRSLRGDPALALHNVEVGLSAVLPHEAALASLPSPFDLDALKSLQRVALALVYAAAQIDRSSPGTVRKLIGRASELRDVLLSSAVALMKAGVLPSKKVEKILSGRGTRDMAQDCIDLAQLFREHQKAVQGKIAVTQEQIDEAAAVGNELIVQLKPARAKAKAPDGVKAAVEARDRLWTLLSDRHADQLRRAGMWLWVDEVDEYVPSLLSGIGRKAKKPNGGGAGGANGRS